MMSMLPAIMFMATCGVAGVVAVEAQQMPDAVEKYGILGLLYVILLAIGAFILKTGGSMVSAIQMNTAAVTQLTTEIKLLVQQHEDQSQRDRDQIDANTDQVLNAIREVRENQRGGKGNGS